uniref:Uncharacterized protein n=1 Tax=Globisporangium ultimum (strain ATCC 200006 / CBS 805.95 / DAOM BR144) TaxID=431595 RepID=K3WPB7_GLOUD
TFWVQKEAYKVRLKSTQILKGTAHTSRLDSRFVIANVGGSCRMVHVGKQYAHVATMMLLFPFCVVSLVSAFVDNAAARDWLHYNCHEGCTQAAMDMAATNGDLEIVKWLHATRSEGCTTEAMDEADSLKMLK